MYYIRIRLLQIMGAVFLLLLFTVVHVDAYMCSVSGTKVSGTHASVRRELCSGQLIFEENFNNLDLNKWKHENTLSGGHHWQFQWYTNNRSNSYTENGILKIRPTLTADHIGEAALSSAVLDITQISSEGCTDAQYWGCSRTGTPDNLLNPIKSASISTKDSFAFRYGRVKIRAKLSKGDWLWPAFWLLPKDNKYGAWPASGEIDIFESRGNPKLIKDGRNIGVEQISSTLHWGPDLQNDRWYKTTATKNNNEGFNAAFHIYEMVWSSTSITIKVDGNQVLSVNPPAGGFWELGEFNTPQSPWNNGNRIAPFDQEFYFVINLAVGGIFGYFPDDASNPGGKPWSNTSPRGPLEFWNGRHNWLPTWNMQSEDSVLQVDYIRVYAL